MDRRSGVPPMSLAGLFSVPRGMDLIAKSDWSSDREPDQPMPPNDRHSLIGRPWNPDRVFSSRGALSWKWTTIPDFPACSNFAEESHYIVEVVVGHRDVAPPMTVAGKLGGVTDLALDERANVRELYGRAFSFPSLSA